MMNSKAGQLGLQGLALSVIFLVIIGVTLAIGAKVVSNIGDDFTANSTESNATEDTLSGLGEISGFMPTIALVLVAVVVLSLLIGGLAVFVRNRL